MSGTVSSLELVPIPFHRDRCNGFWPFGYFSLLNLLGASLWLLSLPQLFALVFASDWSSSDLSKFDFGALYAVGFLWIVVSDFGMSVWSVHGIMKRHRSSVLAVTSAKIVPLLADTVRASESPDESLLHLLALDTTYQIQRREYMEWPFGYLPFAGVTGLGAIVGPILGTAARSLVE